MGEYITKTGCFRYDNNGSIGYIAYSDFNTWSESTKKNWKENHDKGTVKMYCACCPDNTLKLTITADYKIRVANNKLQDQHKPSCPKSVQYITYSNNSAKNGILMNEDGAAVLNIALPSVYKKEKETESEDAEINLESIDPEELIKLLESENDKPEKKEKSDKEPYHRTNILQTIMYLNKVSFEKQTFSIKKAIRQAREQNLSKTDIRYKTFEDFTKQLFGVSNDIIVSCKYGIIPFSQLLYRKDAYYANEDGTRHWFIYAKILGYSEYKEERKYQYMKLLLPSLKGRVTTVRIPTPQFGSIKEEYDRIKELEGCNPVLAGYVVRKLYKPFLGQESDWMQLLKGEVVKVSKSGLYAATERSLQAINYLTEHKILFLTPYVCPEGYIQTPPAIVIQQYREKDILIDFPETKKEYKKLVLFKEQTEEYDCFIFNPEEEFNIPDAMDKLLKLLKIKSFNTEQKR